MKQQRVFFRVLVAVIVGLILLGVGLVLPLSLGGESGESESASDSSIAGESEHYGAAVLFGPFGRKKPTNGDYSKNVYRITYHNATEEYSFVHPTDNDYMSFVMEKDGKIYDALTVNAEQISSVVVTSGTPYVRERFYTGEDAVSKYAEYGLDDTCETWYEIETYGKTLSERGETYRVYIGERATDENGYFCRVDGRDALYITLTPSLGDLVRSGAGAFVSPKCTPDPTDNYAHYFVDGFTVTRETRDTSPVVLTAADTVRVTETLVTTLPGGKTTERTTIKQYYLGSSAVPLPVREALIGKTVGTQTEPVTAHVEQSVASDGGFVTVVYDYTFTEILCRVSRETKIAFSFITDAHARDYYSGGTLYRLDAPSDLTAYFANDTTVMSVLEAFQQITGTSTYKLGFTDADRDALGLMTTVRYRLPVNYTADTTGIDLLNIDANDITVKEYKEITLYVGDKREDGTYLVGSPLYDLVAVVDGTTFAFFDYDLYTWVTPKLMSSYQNLIKTMTFDFGYTDFDESFTFDLSRTVTKQNGKETEYISIPLNGTPVAYDGFSDFYYHLLWQRYSGECGLTDEERERLSAEGDEILRMTVTLYNGDRYVYRFIPYTENRVLVALGKGESAESAVGFFYVPASTVKTFAFDVAAIRDGKTYIPGEKYN